jgi:hypothetical protein
LTSKDAVLSGCVKDCKTDSKNNNKANNKFKEIFIKQFKHILYFTIESIKKPLASNSQWFLFPKIFPNKNRPKAVFAILIKLGLHRIHVIRTLRS